MQSALDAAHRAATEAAAQARAERDALRASHSEQLTQAQENADERVLVLKDALELARETAEVYRAELSAQKAVAARKRGRAAPQDTGD
jgi:hypothetical protein